jgi:hypothetical protein
MKRIQFLLLLSSFQLLRISAFPQGSLTPPGPPAPTMKTLTQIEPRTPISVAPFTISASGSYYLTNNLTVSTGDAITISAGNVTLDLNGYAIGSTQTPAGSGSAILLSAGVSNVRIANGFISSNVVWNGTTFSGNGFGNGINYAGSGPNNAQVRDVAVFGVKSFGISLGLNGTAVDGCGVTNAGAYGIYASSVSNSTVLSGGNYGIYGEAVENCSAASVNGIAISAVTVLNSRASGVATAINAETATNCYAITTGTVTGSGVAAIEANTAVGCQAVAGGFFQGLRVYAAIGCYGSSSSFEGVSAYTAQNCYGNSLNRTGIVAQTATNCYGTGSNSSSGAVGIKASTINNSYGEAVTGILATTSTIGSSSYAGTIANSVGVGHGGAGISADVASDSRGESDSASGLFANYIATNCLGISSSGRGLWASAATNCYGQTTTGDYALLAASANSCRGWQTGGSGIAIHIDVNGIAIGCTAAAGTIELGSGATKYLMP